jgi:hypothetical protein
VTGRGLEAEVKAISALISLTRSRNEAETETIIIVTNVRKEK